MKLNKHLESFEIEHPVFKEKGVGNCGFFRIPFRSHTLNIQSSDGAGWEHVSVSVKGLKRLPNWEEMEHVKNLFWDEEETVLQFHPKKSKYRSIGPVLHLWKKIGVDHELPPRWTVA